MGRFEKNIQEKKIILLILKNHFEKIGEMVYTIHVHYVRLYIEKKCLSACLKIYILEYRIKDGIGNEFTTGMERYRLLSENR